MKEVVHSGNTTNNRVENAKRQLKKSLKTRDSLPCVFKEVVRSCHEDVLRESGRRCSEHERNEISLC